MASATAGLAMLMGACNTDPVYYSDVVPETFFTSEDAVWQRYSRPFTHWKWYMGNGGDILFDLQELSTDEIVLPTRNGDWYNGGLYQNFHHHKFDASYGIFYDGFYGSGMGVALAWDAIRDLEQRVDFEKIGIPESTKELMIAQLNILVADLYKWGLDLYGGMPLYTKEDTEMKGRSTDVETFDFIEKLILDNIDKIPAKETLGAEETTYIHKAWAAMKLAQLYFNAEAYTQGKYKKYDECAKICQDIINGVYGKYALGTSFQQIFGYGNEFCPEVIYGIPSDCTFSGIDGMHYPRWFHYNTNQYLGGTAYDTWNGCAIAPSVAPDGRHYTEADSKLGRVMDKFEDTDLRKQPFTYEGDGKYTGMFLMGYQVSKSKRADKDGSWVCNGAREYQGSVIYLNDCIARFALDGGVKYWNEDGVPFDKDGKEIKRPTINLPSDISTGEEASGYRLMKVCPPVDKGDYDNLRMRMPAMKVVCRLTEAYYMLAECKFRAGDKAGAADLINQVRKRYFVDGKDPNPVTAANLDKYRLLDEWMIEFLGENRRRTDLVRWDAFVTEAWWDHTPSNNKNFNRYPIGESSLASNNLLEQNPGY